MWPLILLTLLYPLPLQEQRYEAASTVYGPHTLSAYLQEFSTLAKALATVRAYYRAQMYVYAHMYCAYCLIHTVFIQVYMEIAPASAKFAF